MITGALIATGGIIVGIALTFAVSWVIDLYNERMYPPPREEKKVAEPPKATCACEHLRSMHSNGTGRCQAWAKGITRIRYTAGDEEKVQCPCQIYDGPEPLLTVLSVERPADGVQPPTH